MHNDVCISYIHECLSIFYFFGFFSPETEKEGKTFEKKGEKNAFFARSNSGKN